MTERITEKEAQAMRHSLIQSGLQGVVVGSAGGRCISDRRIIRKLAVSGEGTSRLFGSASFGPWDGLIDIRDRVQVLALVSDVRNIQSEAAGNGALNSKVPQQNHRTPDVRVDTREAAGSGVA